MSYYEPKKSVVTSKGVQKKALRHRESALQHPNIISYPIKHQIVYVDVILPMGTTRIFGILHEDKVYTKVSAFAPTGVSDPKPYSLLSDRDYNVYKQWLQVKSNSKTRRTAEQMQWVEYNAEKLISEGKEKEKKHIEGQNEYERGQRLNREFQIPLSSLKVGDHVEFQFDKTIWIVALIEKDNIYAIQEGQQTAPRIIGGKILMGFKLL